MYEGFEISLEANSLPFISGDSSTDFFYLYLRGKSRYDANKELIHSNLSSYIRPDGQIDGGSMIKNWFPTVNNHIFLSHSHADEELAIAFSQWLFENFKIKAFIDSTVWGYADMLLKQIDNEYALMSNGKFSYSLRNRTTSFVHNLLSASLSNIIDKCECLMFLNTPNSIIPQPEREETSSPWIFYELQQSNVIRKYIERIRYFSEGGILAEAKEFKTVLPIQTSHLIKLNGKLLYNWKKIVESRRCLRQPEKSLDLLYSLTK